MSLFPYDPFYSRRTLWPTSSNWGHRHMDPLDRMMDRFFDDSMNLQLRDHAAQLNISDQGDLTYKVDVSGFRPEELKVELQANEIIVQGEHREQNHGETVHRQFTRRVLLPEGIHRESIKCDMDNQGRLTILAKSAGGGEPNRSIPIEMKKAIGGGVQEGQKKEIKQ